MTRSVTTLALTADEAQVLRFVLEGYLSDLRMEIADTERYEFREALKQREEFIKKLLAKLP